MPLHYPFSAVVGSDDMSLALLLTAVSPSVGGVLIRGEKGTAKTTTARALAGILPEIEVVSGDRFSSSPADRGTRTPDGPVATDAPVESRPVRLVELPVGATEDRIVGSLHLEKALSEGVTTFEPGLLARAHRGLLYVDEVNLLHDHVVDQLLDAAATGRVTVERDAVSVEHAARFVLIGTMNPEEGELRPQLLDRFGLSVEVNAPRDTALRSEVIRRRMAFDSDPEGFVSVYADDERALRDRIVRARGLLGGVDLTSGVLDTIARVCAGFEVDGMRADIITARAAAAHAAWQGRVRISREDIRVAARMALPHRRRRNPFDAPGIDEELLDRLLGDDEPDPDPDQVPGPDPQGPDGDVEDGDDVDGPGPTDDDQTSDDPADDVDSSADPRAPDADSGYSSESDDTRDSSDPHSEEWEAGEHDGADADEDTTPGDTGPSGPGTVAAASDPYRARLLTVRGTGKGAAGRRSRAVTSTGRRTGSSHFTGGDLHLPATIRAAAPWQGSRGRHGGVLAIAPGDLRSAVREGRESNLVLFCVDASGSMAARKRMEQVKTAILSLLLDAYRRRDKVGLITFRGPDAEVTLPPTSSVDVAAARLDELPAGGRTPLAEGLLTAGDLLRVERLRDPHRRPLLVVVTDGRATHGPDAVHRSRRAAQALAASGTASVVVDCETGRFRMGLAAGLATHLAAEHIPLGEVTADGLTGTVRAHTTPRAQRVGMGEVA